MALGGGQTSPSRPAPRPPDPATRCRAPAFRPLQIIAQLTDGDGTTFSDTGLPTSLDVADFTRLNCIQVIYRDPNDANDQRSVFGDVGFASVAVPEPGIALLLLTTAVAACRLRRS